MRDSLNNYEKILKEIEDIKKRVGRTDDVLLLAVTKMVDEDLVRKFIGYGVTDIGENKVQDMEKRIEVFGDSVNYHLIGTLQRNKINKIIGKTKLIHSVDSIRLIDAIDKRSEREGVVTDFLVQLNISGEETKSGFSEEELDAFVKHVKELENVRLRGIMTMAPHVEDEDLIRSVFRRARELKEKIQNDDQSLAMDYLSMGMSHDYKIAVEEGSTIVRLGTILFGERNY